MPKIYSGVFSESSIRWLIFNENLNGFSNCVIRIGKRVLIDLDSFEEWVNQQRGKTAMTPWDVVTSMEMMKKKK